MSKQHMSQVLESDISVYYLIADLCKNLVFDQVICNIRADEFQDSRIKK
jgi:hypothetical protein